MAPVEEETNEARSLGDLHLALKRDSPRSRGFRFHPEAQVSVSVRSLSGALVAELQMEAERPVLALKALAGRSRSVRPGTCPFAYESSRGHGFVTSPAQQSRP